MDEAVGVESPALKAGMSRLGLIQRPACRAQGREKVTEV